MYLSNGNYEAFANPLKPAGVEKKSAYIIGGGGILNPRRPHARQQDSYI